MRSKTLTYLPTLGASGALLGLALLTGTWGASRNAAEEDSATSGLTGTEAIQVDDATPRRHRRHSLTMPYFSFAQSLRPRN